MKAFHYLQKKKIETTVDLLIDAQYHFFSFRAHQYNPRQRQKEEQWPDL